MKKSGMMLLIVSAMMLFSGCAKNKTMTGDVKIWVAENTVDFTKSQVEAFQAAHPQYASVSIRVEPVGEGDAANHMLTDVESGADIFGFAQDQLARLVGAGALEQLSDENAGRVAQMNDASSVSAVQVGDVLYAYPMTSDNGYFLYYDASIVSDPSSLEQILSDCQKAGKNFYMEINNGWYQPAFFFGAGCTLSYSADRDGRITAVQCNYASENGVKALKSMIKLSKSPAFVNGSSASNATNLGAIVDGTWDAALLQSMLGEHYATAKLPTVDGYQLGGFSGFKMLGVKPQTDEAKLALCDALALFLTEEAAQTARYEAVGWGPSNRNAQNTPSVQQDAALSALAAQRPYTTNQGQYPAEYWTLAGALGDDVLANRFDGSSDDQLLQVLTTFQSTAASYLSP